MTGVEYYNGKVYIGNRKYISKIKTFAGKETKIKIRDIKRLISTYGYSEEEIEKKRGETILSDNGKNRKAEVYLYEVSGKKLIWRLKGI